MTISYVPEVSRADRSRNIAVAYNELHASHPTSEGASTERLRKHIRTKLGMPTLSGEDHLGDLRAHGDALGGHGLELQVDRKKVRGKSIRVVPFNDANQKKIDNFLDQLDNSILI